MGLNFDDNNPLDDNGENLFEEFEDSIITEDSSLDEGSGKPQNRSFIVAVSVLGGGFLIILIALIVYSMMILPQRSAAQRDENMMIYAQASATSQELTMQAVSIVLQPTNTAIAEAEEHGIEDDAAEDTPEALATEAPTDEPPEVPVVDDTEGEEGAAEEGDAADDTNEATNTPLPTLTNTIPVAEALPDEDRQATLDQLLTVLAAGGTETSTPEPGEAGGEGIDEAATPLAGPDALTATAVAAGVLDPGEGASPGYLPETGFVDETLPYLLGGALLLVIIVIIVRRVRLANSQ